MSTTTRRITISPQSRAYRRAGLIILTGYYPQWKLLLLLLMLKFNSRVKLFPVCGNMNVLILQRTLLMESNPVAVTAHLPCPLLCYTLYVCIIFWINLLLISHLKNRIITNKLVFCNFDTKLVFFSFLVYKLVKNVCFYDGKFI